VLIDEYDAPLVHFLNKPHLLEGLREIMRGYYTQLKGLGEYISFLFATGVSRNSHLGLFSTVNHITDLTIDSEYGAMLGFTHDELEKYFDPQLEESARSLRMTKEELLNAIKSYYNGFSFDGRTLVYNPYSTLMFFSKREKHFDNYWFNTATSKSLADFMKNKRLTVEQFSGVTIPRSFAKTPGALDEADAMSFLYQAGYLSLRPGPDGAGGQGALGKPVTEDLDVIPPVESDGVEVSEITNSAIAEELFTLDYPNTEVRLSMSRLVLGNIVDNVVQGAQAAIRVRSAFDNMNVDGVVEEYNNLLARLPYEDYKKPFSLDIKKGVTITDPGERLFRSVLFALIWGAWLRPIGEFHGSHGRSDIVVPHRGRHWVIELKISKKTVVNDQAKAKEGLNQILNQGYAKGLDNPVLLALTINEPKREVTTWSIGSAWKERTSGSCWNCPRRLPSPPGPEIPGVAQETIQTSDVREQARRPGVSKASDWANPSFLGAERSPKGRLVESLAEVSLGLMGICCLAAYPGETVRP
jgi:hypothetical protein